MDEIKFELKNKFPYMFRYFFDVVKNHLEIIDNRSSYSGEQTLFSNDYLIIGFELWKHFERHYEKDETIKWQVNQFESSDDNFISKITYLSLFQPILDELNIKNIRETVFNLNQIINLSDEIIELKSTNNYISKKLFYTAFMLQLVYPKEYPKDKYTNQKALIRAKELMKYEKEFIDKKDNSKTEHFLNVLEQYKHFKNKLLKKLAL